MSTNAQFTANRANAQLSTGPITEAGRTRSALNAVKAGLTGRTVLLASEDAELYNNHLRSYFESYKPVGDEETALVQSLADTNWRIHRIPALEAGIYALGHIELKDCFAQEPDPAVRRHLIETKIYLDRSRQFNNLMIQEGRLRRQEEKDRKRLQELQEARVQRTRQRLASAAKDYLKAVESGEEAGFIAQTQQIGFEFSIEAIKSAANGLKSNSARNLGFTLQKAA